MRTTTLCQSAAVIIVVSMIVQPRALVIVPLLERGGIGNLFALMLLSILALAVLAVVGLWRCRWWGFVAFYGYAITTTILLGSALIPFVIALVPDGARVPAVIAINAVALVAVALLHWRSNQQSTGGT